MQWTFDSRESCRSKRVLCIYSKQDFYLIYQKTRYCPQIPNHTIISRLCSDCSQTNSAVDFFFPMNYLKCKVFWWIWLPMGSLKKSSRVVLTTTLGNNIYMQISAAIIENRIFFNNFFVMNSNVSKMVSTPIFSWSRITINIFIES